MKMSRLLNDIGESLKDREHLAQDAQLDHEESSANQEDADNISQERDGSEDLPKPPNSHESIQPGAGVYQFKGTLSTRAS